MADAHKNFAYSTVLTAPTTPTAGTTVVVQSGDGTKFPTPPFNAVVWPAASQPTVANAEIVRVTGIAADTLTIVRTQESSTNRTVLVGDQISANITAQTLTDIESTFVGNDFESQSATVRDITLDASKDFLVLEAVEIGSGFVLEIPATSSLEIRAYVDNATQLLSPNIYNPYMFRVALTTAVNTGTPVDTYAVVPFNVKSYDNSNNVSPTGVFTAPVAGKYWFTSTIGITEIGSNTYEMGLFLNGALYSRGNRDNINTVEIAISVTDIIPMNAGDTVDVRASSSGAEAVSTLTTSSYFTGKFESK